MSVLVIFLMVLSAVLFIISAFGVPSPRLNLVSAGLFCWVLAEIFMRMPLR